jgi:cytidylate kinase
VDLSAPDLKPPKEPNVLASLEHPLIVAIDGGAGSGKSSVAKQVADAIGGAPVLDSGRWFRALGLIALRNQVDPENPAEIEALGKRFSFSSAPQGSPDELIARDMSESSSFGIATNDLETPVVAQHASIIGKHKKLRAIFQERQLEQAQDGCITVGRAQGSEVFPAAFTTKTGRPVLRILLHADLETRAARRFRQQSDREPTPEELLKVKEDLRLRDERDMTRPVAPLLAPDEATKRDYIVIDTSNLTSRQVTEQIVARIREIAPNLSTNCPS